MQNVPGSQTNMTYSIIPFDRRDVNLEHSQRLHSPLHDAEMGRLFEEIGGKGASSAAELVKQTGNFDGLLGAVSVWVRSLA
jgi:hypothetical protein